MQVATTTTYCINDTKQSWWSSLSCLHQLCSGAPVRLDTAELQSWRRSEVETSCYNCWFASWFISFICHKFCWPWSHYKRRCPTLICQSFSTALIFQRSYHFILTLSWSLYVLDFISRDNKGFNHNAWPDWTFSMWCWSEFLARRGTWFD